MLKMTQTFVSLRCKACLTCVINRPTMLSVRSSSGGWMWWCIIILVQQLHTAEYVACICCHEILSVWQIFFHEMLSIWQIFCHEYDCCLLTVYLHSCYFIWFVDPPCFLYDHPPFSVLSLGTVLPVIVQRCCLCDCPTVLSVWSSIDVVCVSVHWCCLCKCPSLLSV